MASKVPKDKGEWLQRRQKAMELRRQGKTYIQIGKELGISQPRAWKLVSEEIQRIQDQTAETAKEVLEIELQRLDDSIAVCMTILKDDEACDETKLKAIDRILKAQDRRAKYLGLDAPKSMNVSVQNDPIKSMTDEELMRVINGDEEDEQTDGRCADDDQAQD
jgi:hypothetical protein